jgi:hypothetical protein
MKCEKYNKMISDSFDGNLSPGQKKKLEKHLATCKPCQAHHEALSLIQQQALALRGPDFLPEQEKEFERRVRKIIEQSATEEGRSKEKPKWFLTKPAWVTGGIFFLVVVLAIIFLGNRQPQEIQMAMMLSYEESYLSISQVMEEDETLAQNFNEELVNSIALEVTMEEEIEYDELQDYYMQNNQINSEKDLLRENIL